MNIQADQLLDAKGLACPMPIVKTKKAIEVLVPGAVLEVQATDKGSIADLKSWASRTGNHYIGSRTQGEVIHHYIRKANPLEETTEQQHLVIQTNEELQRLLQQADFWSKGLVLDVREPAEYLFGHIDGAISIPFGVLDKRASELDSAKHIYVVCRTGNRSDAASQLLSKLGFANVTNIMPGMSQWTGPVTEKE